MPGNSIVRCAHRSDLAVIAAIGLQSFDGLHSPVHVIRQHLDVFDGLFLVSSEGASSLCNGYTIAAVSPADSVGWILSLAIAPKHRRLGLGRRLTRTALSRLGDHDVGLVRLTVHPDNTAAINLYTDLGFVVTAEEDDYFGNGESRLLMQNAIRRTLGEQTSVVP